MGEIMTHIPKGSFKKDYHNLNVRDAHKYSIVEDMAQTRCAMSALEFLQSFPSQRKVLLSSLGVSETTNSRNIVFDPTNYKPHLPHHITF
jgi:hypothetical protein